MSDAQNGAPANGAPELSGKVMLYSNPKPLSIEEHSKLGLKNIERPFNFVATTHVVPLTVQEFGIAASSLPIIFGADQKTPLAVLGARTGENVYVDKNGFWELDSYVPAFIRRYPFIFAADETNDNFVVCIDENAEMIGENPDLPLFVDGKPSDYTNGAMQFLQDFERQRRATDEWVEIINKYDLLEQKSVTFTPTNPDGSQAEAFKIADYWAVSEEKLNALDDDKFLEIKNNGALAAIYAHLVSLLQWQKVVQRSMRLNNEAAVANA